MEQDQTGPEIPATPTDTPTQPTAQPPAAPPAPTPSVAAGPEPTPAPEGVVEPPPRLWAGKYSSPEEMERGFMEQRELASRHSAELGETRRALEELQHPPEPEAPPLSPEDLVQLQYDNPAAWRDGIRQMFADDIREAARAEALQLRQQERTQERVIEQFVSSHSDLEPHLEYADAVAKGMDLSGFSSLDEALDAVATETRRRLNLGQGAQPPAQPPPVSPSGGAGAPPGPAGEPADLAEIRRRAIEEDIEEAEAADAQARGITT